MAVGGESRDFAAAALAGLALFDVVMNIIDQLRSRGEAKREQIFHFCLKLLLVECEISLKLRYIFMLGLGL